MQKELRQAEILRTIAETRIGRQEELAEILEQKGYSVTQSSVSRDLLELGVVKAGGFYSLPAKTATAFGLRSVEPAGDNLVVVKCDSGLASACAVRIDGSAIEGIVGTVAGDDTVFIAVRDAKSGRAAIRRIWELF